MMNIVFVGSPGSGKGTQSTRLARTLGLIHLSTGDILRKEMDDQTPLGLKCRDIINSGDLISDPVICSVVSSFIDRLDEPKGFVFDGFPRNVQQAGYLLSFMDDRQQRLRTVIHLHVPDDVIIQRIAGRFFCASCGAIYNDHYKPLKVDGRCDDCGHDTFKRRSDDEPSKVAHRLDVFHQENSPMMDFLKTRLDIVSIDGTRDEDRVFDDILASIGNR